MNSSFTEQCIKTSFVYYRYNNLLGDRDNCHKEILELRSLLIKTEDHWQEQMTKLRNEYEAKLSRVITFF